MSRIDDRELYEVLEPYIDLSMPAQDGVTPIEDWDIADIVRMEEIVTAEIQRRAAEDALEAYTDGTQENWDEYETHSSEEGSDFDDTGSESGDEA